MNGPDMNDPDMNDPDMNDPDMNEPGTNEPGVHGGRRADARLDRRLQQLAAEQAAAAPAPLDWEHVERRPAPATGRSRRGPAAVAAAAVVLVVGAALVVVTARGADAPTTLGPGDTTPTTPSPAQNDASPDDESPDDGSEPTEPAPTTDAGDSPDDDPGPGDDGAAVEIPHAMLIDGEPLGPTWSVTVADTAEEQEALWAQLEVDIDVDPALVDPATNVVIHFGPAASSSCPFGSLVAVRHDPATGHLFPDLPVEGGPDCTDDANPHAVVVVIARADLPDEAFTVWVENADPPACCTDDVVRVGAGELATPPEPPPATPPGSPPGSGTDEHARLPDGVSETTGVAIPSGDIEAGPDDLAVAHVDGDLWYHPGLLGPAPGAPFRLVELTDPREPVTEGPPPNQVDHVAGVHDGTLVHGTCCEPVSGNVLATGGADAEPVPIQAGYTPVIDPAGRRLAAANSFLVGVVDLTTGTQWVRVLDDVEDAPFDVWGVTWTADGDSLVLLTSDADGYALRPLTGDVPLEVGGAVPIGVDLDPTLERRVGIAGVAADGAIALAETGPDGPTLVRYHDPDTLAEDRSRRAELDPGTTSIRVTGDEMLWIDGDELYHRVGDGPTRRLGDGFRAAWFLR